MIGWSIDILLRSEDTEYLTKVLGNLGNEVFPSKEFLS